MMEDRNVVGRTRCQKMPNTTSGQTRLSVFGRFASSKSVIINKTCIFFVYSTVDRKAADGALVPFVGLAMQEYFCPVELFFFFSTTFSLRFSRDGRTRKKWLG